MKTPLLLLVGFRDEAMVGIELLHFEPALMNLLADYNRAAALHKPLIRNVAREYGFPADCEEISRNEMDLIAIWAVRT